MFNGEIYNYRDLRRSLEARGERFTTGSDTEVLLRLLACDGPAALAQVRGMFALAWWDAEARALVLARDRFGIKPLYVAATDRSIAFASEIHALVSSGLVERAIDPAGVLGFLAWGTVPPPLTYVAGVESLAPGSWLRWSHGGAACRQTYADVAGVYARPHSGCTESDLRERAGAAVQQSVAAHLVADVPVGVFLSGGIDSSAILSAASDAGVAGAQHLHRPVRRPVLRARVRQAGRLDVRRDAPRARARSVADRRRPAAHSGAARSADARRRELLLRVGGGGRDRDQGRAVGRRAATKCSAAIRRSAACQRRCAGRSASRPLGPAMTPIVAAVLPERLTERWRHFMSGNGRMDAAYRTQRGLFMPAEVERLAGPALRDRWVGRRRRASRRPRTALFDGDASTLEGHVARLETRIYLGSQLLRDLDVMSMAHGLEVRVPFVDHVLLDAVWPDLGAHPSLMRNKRLLHETLERPLPPAAVESAEAGVHAAVRAMDGRRSPAVRPLGHGAPRRRGMDCAWRARRDLGRVAARRRALEPSMGARHARRIPEEPVIDGADAALSSFSHRRDYADVAGRDRWTVRVVNAWVRAALPPLLAVPFGSGPVLDVGCAEQPFRPLIESSGRRYVGMDVVQNRTRTVDILSTLEDAPTPMPAVSGAALHRSAGACRRHRRRLCRAPAAGVARRRGGADGAVHVSRCTWSRSISAA